ncbi:endo-1,4-beta-xylanase [Chitinispirillales bacterium ANBcel5]|uniref:endo-1,4-beta-xylanase n=1 Tax=Cellulosispirillum alkaliphilum TaxID=3039283 RepID=UPI002A528C04|nr:endo-1,4-beta-xylanase [Chitinispirillales bacterium ANBcel5]
MTRFKSIAAVVMLVALFARSVFAQTVVIRDRFEVSYDGWTNSGDGVPVLNAVRGEGYNSGRAMMVSGRTLPKHGAASLKEFYIDDGEAYNYSVHVRHAGAEDETFNLTLQWQLPDGTFKSDDIASAVVKPNTWTALTASYTTPSGSFNPTFFITTNSNTDFYFDEFTATGRSAGSLGKAMAPANTPSDVGLQDIYAGHFRVGNILNGHTANNAGIQNMFRLEYNSATAENEHKPDATMTRSGSTNTNIRAQINTGAAAIMNFCEQNNIPMRGHVLAWHGQSPDWFFVEDINDQRARQSTSDGPRYRDIPVDEVPWASVDVMNSRLESYIENLFNLYEEQYPDLIFYAYDVVNEAAGGSGGLRAPGFDHQGAGGQAGSVAGASPWQAIYGENSIDWIRNAFVYARRHVPAHTRLFYNDYNEWHEPKRNWIAENILIPFHNDGILDGMGMQSHVSANPNDGWSGEDRHLAAMDYYANLGIEVQLTELDPSTHGGQYVDQQPGRYANIFNKAMEINARDVGKITAIVMWCPNDANTWLGSENSPSLHDGSNNRKPAYDAVAALVPQSEWGDGSNPTFESGNGGGTTEPNEWGWWFHDTFEDNAGGWQGRGDASVETSTEYSALGERSLAITGRTAEWHGAIITLPAGFVADTTYSFSVCALYTGGDATEEIKLTLEYTVEGETQWADIALVTAPQGQWVQLANPDFQIPSGATGLRIIVESPSNTTIPLYIDEMIGAVAGTGIAAPEGVLTESTSMKKLVGNNTVRPRIAVSGKTMNINSPAGNEMRIRLINIRGKTVANHTASGSARISLERIPAGRYFVQVRSVGVIHTTPIIVK